MANASKFLDKRFKLSNGNYKVRIRVTHERKSIYLNTKFSFDEKTYKGKIEKGLNMNNNEDLTRARAEILAIETKANHVIKNMPVFTFEEFKTRFEQKGDRSDIIALLLQEAKDLKEAGKFSNANIYLSTGNVLQRYAMDKYKKDTLKVSMLTVNELQSFQAWAEKETPTKKAYSLTTISIYLVRVQKIFNTLIASGELNQSAYPFGKGLYQIPETRNAKRPLTIDEIMLIYNYKPLTKVEDFAKSMFMFSYLCSGMNMADIFNLKHSDISGDRLTFVRRKTKNKTPKTLTVILNQDIIDIIDRHKVHVLNSDYVFKIFTAAMTDLERHNAKDVAIAAINRSLKSIAKKIGLRSDVSTYFARHAFATILMESEAPLAFISQKLGHSSLQTTQAYLSQFSKDKEEKYTSNLLKKNIG
jgi:integrase/recombinase XerD